MPKFDANLSMLFGEVDFLDRFEAAAKAGFTGIEYLFPYAYKKELLVEKLEEQPCADTAQPSGRELGEGRAGDWLPSGQSE